MGVLSLANAKAMLIDCDTWSEIPPWLSLILSQDPKIPVALFGDRPTLAMLR